jgi:hypothetical protein
MVSSEKYFCPSGWRLRKSQAAQATTCCIYAHRFVTSLSFSKEHLCISIVGICCFPAYRNGLKDVPDVNLFNRYQGGA